MEVHKEDVTDKILSTKVGGWGEREKERPTCISMLFKLMCSSLSSLRIFFSIYNNFVAIFVPKLQVPIVITSCVHSPKRSSSKLKPWMKFLIITSALRYIFPQV